MKHEEQLGTTFEEAGRLANWPKVFFKKEIYPWQREILENIELKHSRSILQACNGSGKTSLIAATAVLWHMVRFPRSVAICTAGVYRQVVDQLWPRMREYVEDHLAPMTGAADNWQVKEDEVVYKPGQSRALGFSTDQGNKFEGFHTTGPSANLLIVVDEAKSVPDSIFWAVERCQPTRVLVMSSTGDCKGEFYKLCMKPPAGWKHWKVTARECPHLKEEWVQEQVARWGPEHPLVKSMIFSEFMEGDGQLTFVSWARVDYAMSNKNQKRPGAKVGFWDPAAAENGDENVFAVLDGNEILPLVAWRDRDAMGNCARAILEAKRVGLRPEEMWMDMGGIGQIYHAKLKELGWHCNGAYNGDSAYDKDAFQNRGTEIWVMAARVMDEQKVILPRDEKLLDQITSRLLLRNRTSQKLQAEPKPDMQRRGKTSPDRADAAMGAIAHSELVWAKPRISRPLETMWQLVDEEGTAGGNLPYFAGV
jgi:hypothetical protein